MIIKKIQYEVNRNFSILHRLPRSDEMFSMQIKKKSKMNFQLQVERKTEKRTFRRGKSGKIKKKHVCFRMCVCDFCFFFFNLFS